MLVLSKLSRYNIKSFGQLKLINTYEFLGYISYLKAPIDYIAIRIHKSNTIWRLLYKYHNNIKYLSLFYVGYKKFYTMNIEERYVDNHYEDPLLTITSPLAEMKITIKKRIFTSQYTKLNKWAGIQV